MNSTKPTLPAGFLENDCAIINNLPVINVVTRCRHPTRKGNAVKAPRAKPWTGEGPGFRPRRSLRPPRQGELPHGQPHPSQFGAQIGEVHCLDCQARMEIAIQASIVTQKGATDGGTLFVEGTD